MIHLLILLLLLSTAQAIDPSLRQSLRIEFQKYDTDDSHALNMDEFLRLIDNLHLQLSPRSVNHLLDRKSCGTHLLQTCLAIQKLSVHQTKAVLLHRMCSTCQLHLDEFPPITGHPLLPMDWRNKKISEVIERDKIKRTGKDSEGKWLSGKAYMARLKRL